MSGEDLRAYKRKRDPAPTHAQCTSQRGRRQEPRTRGQRSDPAPHHPPSPPDSPGRVCPLNAWGGRLSAGQTGGPAGGLNGISEAVLQLQHRAGERQVKGARLAVVTGYGMTMYRYGGTAAAAVLERAE